MRFYIFLGSTLVLFCAMVMKFALGLHAIINRQGARAVNAALAALATIAYLLLVFAMDALVRSRELVYWFQFMEGNPFLQERICLLLALGLVAWASLLLRMGRAGSNFPYRAGLLVVPCPVAAAGTALACLLMEIFMAGRYPESPVSPTTVLLLIFFTIVFGIAVAMKNMEPRSIWIFDFLLGLVMMCLAAFLLLLNAPFPSLAELEGIYRSAVLRREEAVVGGPAAWLLPLLLAVVFALGFFAGRNKRRRTRA